MGDPSKNMKPTDYIKSDINILLLGASGVGKSTFINSFANYLQYGTLDQAIDSKLICLIPAKITITNQDYEETILSYGFDQNEDTEVGNSSTQATRAYVFTLAGENRKIRLIDTPGIGDARGIEQDNKNLENILMYLSQFKEIHAICFLLKPNDSVVNAYFKFCLMHLLSRLEKTAKDNIIFIFTNSRGTGYAPLETLSCLRKILKSIKESPPNVEIPCSKDNMFSLDNEAFKYLVALKNNLEFGKKSEFIESWNVSTKACWDMLRYIAGDENRPGLQPHLIQNTLSVNDARRIILDLSKPLADITDLVQDNLTVLDRHQNIILQSNLSIAELQKSLYVPAINLKQTSLPNPVTVCTSDKCAKVYTFSGISKYHYKQQCHKDCNLPNVPTELIGTPLLLKCEAIDPATNQCKYCKCDFSTHMHITYDTELFEDKVEDESVKRQITNEEEVIRAKYDYIQKLKERSKEYLEEKSKISQAIAKFAYFLNENSISPGCDAFENYIDYLIDREKSRGPDYDKDILTRFVDLKKQYAEEKAILQHAVLEAKTIDNSNFVITSSDIFKYVDDLYNLKHTGKKIRELHKKQTKVRMSMHEKSMEYCHPEPIEKPSKKKNKGKDKKTLKAEEHLNDISEKIRNLKMTKESTSSEGRDTLLLENLLSEYFKESKSLNNQNLPVREVRNNLDKNSNQNTKGKGNKNTFPIKKTENIFDKKNPSNKNKKMEKQNNTDKKNDTKPNNSDKKNENKQNNSEKKIENKQNNSEKQSNDGQPTSGKPRQKRQPPKFNQPNNQSQPNCVRNQFQNQPPPLMNPFPNQPYPYPNQPQFNQNQYSSPHNFPPQSPFMNQPGNSNQYQNFPNQFQNPRFPHQHPNYPNSFPNSPNPFPNQGGNMPNYQPPFSSGSNPFEASANPFANYQKMGQAQAAAGSSGMSQNPSKDGKKSRNRNKKDSKQSDGQFKKSNPRRNKREESDGDSSDEWEQVDVKKIENLIKNVTMMGKKEKDKDKDLPEISLMQQMLNSTKKMLEEKEKEVQKKLKKELFFVYSSNE